VLDIQSINKVRRELTWNHFIKLTHQEILLLSRYTMKLFFFSPKYLVALKLGL